MNDNNLNQNSGTYKATANLNTAIDNPQINVNSATGVNVQDLGYNNYVEPTNVDNNVVNNNIDVSGNNDNLSNINSSSNTNLDTSLTNTNSSVNASVDSSLNNGISDVSDINNASNVSTISDTTNVNYTYAPTLEEKKIKQESVISILFHSKEFKALILIVFILFLFLLVMPSLYDFIRNLKLLR